MESANLSHLHQHQEQLSGSCLSLPFFHGVGSSQIWNQNSILNGDSIGPNVNGGFSGSRELTQRHKTVVPPLVTSMFQDSGFHWATNAESYTNHSPHELHLAKINEELSDSFPKFNESSNLEEFHLPSTSYIKHEQQYLQDLNEKLMLKNFSSSCHINGFQISAGSLYSNPQSSATFQTITTTPSRGNLSRIYPSSNISSTKLCSLPYSSSLSTNLQALDLLHSARSGGCFSQPSLNNLPLLGAVPFDLDRLSEPRQISNSPSNISSMNGVTETKRANGISEAKASPQPFKKPRLESLSSFPQFKVRKEKLGDRIATLQQLVAPFGKTDTTSVLMEAIGYIKFLHDHIETLSMPYMKSSDNETCRRLQTGSNTQELEEEPEQDLRSRGLCLVPLSCTSYVANDSKGVLSPPYL